ncbi:MAG TPA: NAD kinase [Cryptosporangiaceae bacterium]|nr:NAD kinase [Cryptosporangiaceae bacterium]
MSREALLVIHTGRAANVDHARRVAEQLAAAGFGIRILAGETIEMGLPQAREAIELGLPEARDAIELGLPQAREVLGDDAALGVEIVVALGGDGTLLRAAGLARPAGKPLLGVNLGRVGFLTEVEAEDLDSAVRRVVERDYAVDERLTVDVTVHDAAGGTAHSWALNEASVERAARKRMLEVLVSVDGDPLSRWGCDGVVCATPTGSTAYALSAGGPVVWPELEALLLVPVSAHALFNRPLVIAPTSTITVEVVADGPPAVVVCDGQRVLSLPPGSRAEVRRGADPVRVVRLHDRPFTDRLVAKFGLPVDGWRRPADEPR